MTATIRVHALSRGGFMAESRRNGRFAGCAGETLEQAAQNLALRLAGHSKRVGRDGDYSMLEEFNIQLRHTRSEMDEEIYTVEAADE